MGCASDSKVVDKGHRSEDIFGWLDDFRANVWEGG
jgi:hypothetical protein